MFNDTDIIITADENNMTIGAISFNLTLKDIIYSNYYLQAIYYPLISGSLLYISVDIAIDRIPLFAIWSYSQYSQSLIIIGIILIIGIIIASVILSKKARISKLNKSRAKIIRIKG